METHEAPRETELVDPTVLRQYGSDEASVEFQRELVALFGADTAGRVEEMSRAQRRDDAPAVKRVAHSVRGASTMIGAVAVGEICAEIEAACAVGDPSGLGALVERLEDAVARTSVRLHDLVGA